MRSWISLEKLKFSTAVFCCPGELASFLLHLAGKVFLLDACDVLSGHDNESEVAVGQLHLDGGRVGIGGGRCFGSLFWGGLAVLVGVC